MISKTKALQGMAAALVLGVVVGSAASLFIAGESVWGENWWTHLEASLLLSPFLVTIGLLVSAGTKGLAFFLLLCAGGFCCFTSCFLGIRRRFPLPQWLMFAGAFVWSLGNATALDAMMGI